MSPFLIRVKKRFHGNKKRSYFSDLLSLRERKKLTGRQMGSLLLWLSLTQLRGLYLEFPRRVNKCIPVCPHLLVTLILTVPRWSQNKITGQLSVGMGCIWNLQLSQAMTNLQLSDVFMDTHFCLPLMVEFKEKKHPVTFFFGKVWESSVLAFYVVPSKLWFIVLW